QAQGVVGMLRQAHGIPARPAVKDVSSILLSTPTPHTKPRGDGGKTLRTRGLICRPVGRTVTAMDEDEITAAAAGVDDRIARRLRARREELGLDAGEAAAR